MSENKPQDYKSHRRLSPLYHGLTGGLIVLTLIGSLVNLSESWKDHDRFYSASLLVVVSLLFILMFFIQRGFALRAQDRAIRAEENFRFYILTGKPFDKRLKMGQIIALRFAPDEELVELAQQAAEKNMTNDEIKRAIKQWKADHHRA
ncbi:MAG: hypothetical protein EOP53_15495 [Sphingobacteriales bacterium]|nr:MAG: hypothetical protein EOP53_15495 [Sphingobacteriales bacterium]